MRMWLSVTKSSNTMYDFYEKPPQNRKDLREWLTTWLEPVTATEVEIKGEKYIQVLGFRRAFCIHTVFRNVVTNEYKWYVLDECCDDYRNFPEESYPSYEKLIDGVIESYYKLWKLTG